MIEKKVFGRLSSGEEVHAYTLSNSKGMTVVALNYGGIIQSMLVPDKDGKLQDVCLGYDRIEDYEASNTYFGALVGRSGNRIEHGELLLNGKVYQLTKNVGGNHLHGGARGFDKRVWDAEIQNGALKLELLSPDEEEGYPGNLKVTVTYSLEENNAFTIQYRGCADTDTIFNPLSHSYFNLNGHNSGTVLEHLLKINGPSITEKSSDRAINGEFLPVAGTPLDFQTSRKIGQGIDAPHPQLQYCSGYDHNYVLNNLGAFRCAAVLEGDQSGIRMEIVTDRPGLQLYTGNGLNDVKGKDATVYVRRSGVCLEPQCLPDAVHFPHFPSPVLKKGHTFQSLTTYRFF